MQSKDDSKVVKAAFVSGIFLIIVAVISGGFQIFNTYLDRSLSNTVKVIPSLTYVPIEKPLSIPTILSPSIVPSAQPTIIATDTPALPTNDVVKSAAVTSCAEFGGVPSKTTVITRENIAQWKAIGSTPDRNLVGRVIYCQIHQVPGYRGYVSGDTIPAGVVITGDIGTEWTKRYAGNIDGLIYQSGGGWGVFMTLRSVTIQNSAGQYWFISN